MKTQLEELNEAIAAGQRVLEQLDYVEDQLGRAKTWGWIDMFSRGGFISAMFKHARMEDADYAMRELAARIDAFNAEVQDLMVFYNVEKISMGGGWVFADLFFDGIFVDALVLSHIGDAQRQVAEIRPQIVSAVDRLAVLRDEYIGTALPGQV